MIYLFNFIKRFIIASVLLYSFDVFAVSLNLSIPINFCTLLLVTFFDISAIICLVLFSFIF